MNKSKNIFGDTLPADFLPYEYRENVFTTDKPVFTTSVANTEKNKTQNNTLIMLLGAVIFAKLLKIF